ncbi:MAG TPA: peptidoglycan-associated lipoprotein Pal [Candidatus Binataceae bacterium]|nr:peptidoglycan-associated lipoprotein Pal [Candidatus Binataceae bacterium]
MIPTHHGRGGSAGETGRIARIAGLAALIVTLALFGCSSKKTPGPGEGGAGGNQGGIGSQGMGAGGGNSLEKYQKGQLGGEQGPLGDIHFDYNDFTVRQQDGDILHSNADWLQKNPNAHVQIEGHCDDRGSEEYNIALGAKRAQAARDYLVTLGISADRMSTISYGKELPLCTDETDDCWAQNRRDHFAIAE